MEVITRIIPCGATPHARERRTAPRALLTPPASWPLSGVDAPSLFAARRGSKAGGAREVTCAASLGAWGAGGTKGARQRRPSARPGPAPACEDRSAEGLSRRSNTEELQTLKKLQSG